MDNYRKQQPEKSRYRSRSIDGFFQSGAASEGLGPNTGRRPVFSDRLRDAQQPQQKTSSYSQPNQATLDEMRKKRQQLAREQQLTQRAAAAETVQPQKQQKLQTRDTKNQTPPMKRPRRFAMGKDARAARKAWRRHVRATRPTWKKWLIRITVVLTILVIGLVGFLGFKGYLKLRDIFKGGGYSAALDGNVDPNKLKGEGDGRVNILLLGRGGEGHDGPDLTDTILIASIDPVNNKSALLSIPRDLWVRTDYGTMKINALFARAKESAMNKNGGNVADAEAKAAQVVKGEMNDVFGINMHYYAMIDFEGFGKAVDTLGGVTIDVPEDLRDSTMAWLNGGRSLLVPAGRQTLDSKHALWYVRSRHGSARGDFDRAERQRLFIAALQKEITSVGTYSNPATVSRLMDDFGNHIRTDFGLNELMRLYELSKKMGEPESIGLVDEPHDFLTTDMISGQSVVVPKAGTFAYEDIKLYIRSALPDGYIVKENAQVTVLNGTSTVGYGSEKADELKSYKYNVVKVDNAPTANYANTVIVDLTEGDQAKYTKNYLEKRFGTIATKTLPEGIDRPEQPGFVIILGSN